MQIKCELFNEIMLINYKELFHKNIEITLVGYCSEGGDRELGWKRAKRTSWKRLIHFGAVVKEYISLHPVKLEKG